MNVNHVQLILSQQLFDIGKKRLFLKFYLTQSIFVPLRHHHDIEKGNLLKKNVSFFFTEK